MQKDWKNDNKKDTLNIWYMWNWNIRIKRETEWNGWHVWRDNIVKLCQIDEKALSLMLEKFYEPHPR